MLVQWELFEMQDVKLFEKQWSMNKITQFSSLLVKADDRISNLHHCLAIFTPYLQSVIVAGKKTETITKKHTQPCYERAVICLKIKTVVKQTCGEDHVKCIVSKHDFKSNTPRAKSIWIVNSNCEQSYCMQYIKWNSYGNDNYGEKRFVS